ncbi:MAG TPA: nuclear transport factor 2 family protein [Streptosporangiaceae bacterium]|nr:nuclear transport factor 2 family protein [Streptosporangiaceae bacterium]
MDEDAIRRLIAAFNAAWNAHDLDAALDLCTPDVVFESTDPAPDGRRFEGRDAVRTAWQPVFAEEQGRFDAEELIVAGDRVVQRWRFDWGRGRVRGVDVITISGGLVKEKLAYVKG